MKRKLIVGMFGLASLFTANMASAATVAVGSTSQVGNELTLNLVGTGFDTGVSAIGMLLDWDTTVLSVLSTSADIAASGAANGFTTPIYGPDLATNPGQLDVTLGTPLGTFLPTTAPDFGFDFFSIVFTVLTSAPEATIAVLSQNIDGAPLDGNFVAYVDTVFQDATIALNPVPIPAAVWLLGSGLLGLVGVARRRSATATTAVA